MKTVYDLRKVAASINIDRYIENSYNFVSIDEKEICRNIAAGLKGEGYTEQDFLDWMQLKQLPELPEGNSKAWHDADPLPGCEILKYAGYLEGDERIECQAYKTDVLLRELYQGGKVFDLDLRKVFQDEYDDIPLHERTEHLCRWLCDAADHARESNEDFYKAMYRDLLFFVITKIANNTTANRSGWQFLNDDVPGEPVIQ